MMQYNPNDWYWSVDGGATRVWSSASRSYVPVADATYVAWLAGGGLPTKITEADLADVANRPILDQLAALDAASARSIRAITVAQHAGQQPSPDDLDALTSHDAAARALREKLL